MIELDLLARAALGNIQSTSLRPDQIDFSIDGDSHQWLLDITHHAAVDDLRSHRLVVSRVILIPHVTANCENHAKHAGAQQPANLRARVSHTQVPTHPSP